MFARNVSIHLKPNVLSDYTRTFENGENKADAEAYNTNIYPQVLKTMARFIEGTPKVQTSDVVNSTFHKIDAAVAA